MKKFRLIAVIIALVLAFTGVYLLYNNLSKNYHSDVILDEESTEKNTVKAPDFTVFDYSGNEVSLSDMKGKPVVVNFWASWCGFCVKEMPDFEALYKKYGEDVHFMMVNVTDNVQETVDSAKIFVDKSGFSFPVYYDLNLSAAYAYKANSLPVTYFIDANGNLVTYAKGKISLKTIEKGINMIM